MSIVSKLDATRRAIVPVIQHGASGVNERDKALLSECFAIGDVNIFSLPRFEQAFVLCFGRPAAECVSHPRAVGIRRALILTRATSEFLRLRPRVYKAYAVCSSIFLT